MSFGIDFKNQWQILEEYGEFGNGQVKNFYKFLQQQSEIEFEYSKNMLKLVKQYKEEFNKKDLGEKSSNYQKAIFSTASSQGWLQLLNETEAISNAHLTFATKIDDEIRKPIKLQLKENELSNKKIFDEIRAQINELKKSIDVMGKSRERHEKSIQEMTLSISIFDKFNNDIRARKDQVEKAKLDCEKKTLIARENFEAYTKQIDETNIFKNEFYDKKLPELLELFQKDDEIKRGEYFKTKLLTYLDLIKKRDEPVKSLADNLFIIFDKLDATYDSETFCKLVKSSEFFIPEDYVFEEKVTNMLRQKSSIGLSGSPTSSISLLCEMEAEDEKVMSVPLKQGKKKANERIKIINKEIEVLNQKNENFNHLLTAKLENSEDINEKLDLVIKEKIKAVEDSLLILTKRKQNLEKYLEKPSEPSGGKVSLNNEEILSDSSSPNLNSPESAKIEVVVKNSLLDNAIPNQKNTLPTLASKNEQVNVSKPLATKDDLVNEKKKEKKTSFLGKKINRVKENTAVQQKTEETVNKESNFDTDKLSAKVEEKHLEKVKAVFEFNGAVESEELSFKVGDEFYVLDKLEDGWWRARSAVDTEKVGLVPGNYME
ncbi:Formin-binding protein 1 [Lobulomyces angularis]|nr:Formin-binding protein 1 [Lobulomyces angularis]